jgi:hypothetical protein
MIKKIPISLIILGLFFACNSHLKKQTKTTQKEKTAQSDHFKPDTLKMFEGLPSNILKGARNNQNICKIKLHYFSKNKTKDTFKLQIPKGPFEYTNSIVTITNSKGKTIYSIIFPTYFIRDGYDLLPETPINLDSLQEKLFNDNYDKSLTKKFYEKYFLNKIENFLINCAFRTKKDDYFFNSEYCLNKSVRNEILKTKNSNCVYFPIHYGDEGTSFIGYSSKKNRAYIFAESD